MYTCVHIHVRVYIWQRELKMKEETSSDTVMIYAWIE